MRDKKIFIAIVILLVLGFAGYHRLTRDIEFEVPGFMSDIFVGPEYSISNHWIVVRKSREYKKDLVLFDIQTRNQTMIHSDIPQYFGKLFTVCDPWIVWKDLEGMYGYDLRHSQKFRICDKGELDIFGIPSVDGNIVVWTDGLKMMGYDLERKEKFILYESEIIIETEPNAIPMPSENWLTSYVNRLIGSPQKSANVMNQASGSPWKSPHILNVKVFSSQEPVIGGDMVAWIEGKSNIIAYNLKSQKKISICSTQCKKSELTLSGRTLVWQEQGADANSIAGYHFQTQDKFSIPANLSIWDHLEVSGHYIVWKEHGQVSPNGTSCSIKVYDMEKREVTTICSDVYSCDFNLSGERLVWSSRPSPLADSDVYGCNLKTGHQFSICTAKGNQDHPKISGNTVVWIDIRLQGWMSRILKKEPCYIRGKIFRHWPGEEKAE
jgi:hypothetical protein